MDEATRAVGLAAERCVACRPGAPRLTEDELAALLPSIPGWAVIERNGIPRLRREFRFPDFAGALTFTVRVGEAAEAEGHHPALLTEWGKVTVSWWTHAIGGLHRNDVVMAAKTDALSAGSRQSAEGSGKDEGGRVEASGGRRR